MSILKKQLSVILAVCMLFGVVPITALATDTGSSFALDQSFADLFNKLVDGFMSDDDVSDEHSYDPSTAALTERAASSGTTSDQPFNAGTGGSQTFRIPAIVTLGNGTLVAAADARWSHGSDGFNIDTIVSYSTDNGKNWNYTFANYIADSGDSYNTEAATFIDPALAVKDDTLYMLIDLYPGQTEGNTCIQVSEAGTGYDNDGNLKLSKSGCKSNSTYDYYLKDGKIYDYATDTDQGYTVDAYFNVPKGEESLGNLFTYEQTDFYVLQTSYLYLTTSKDGGKTWSEPAMLNPQVKTASDKFYGVGPGAALVTSTGRIIFPCYTHDQSKGEGNGNYYDEHTSVIYSDDNGKTWKRSDKIADYSSEAALVEVDGRIYMFVRNPSYTSYYYSDDNGETWSARQSTGLSYTTTCQLSAMVYSKLIDGKKAILLSAPTSGRTNGKIFVGLVNEDKSITWEYTYSVNTGTYQYSSLTELNDGTIGLLYENGGSSIYYKNLSITDIAKGAEIEQTIPTTVTDEANNVSVTADGVETVAVVKQTASAPANGYNKSVTYSITVNNGNYTGAAKVELPVDEVFADCNSFIGHVGSDSFKVTKNGDMFVCEVPHFSDVTISGRVADYDSEVEVDIAIGATKTYTIDGKNYSSDVDKSNLNTNIAEVEIDGQDYVAGTEGTKAGSIQYRNLLSSWSNSRWIKTNYYYLLDDDGQYYPVYAYRTSNSGTYYVGYSKTDSTSAVTRIDSGSSTRQIDYLYTASGIPEVPASTTVTITGVHAGVTEAIVGTTKYNINVAYAEKTITIRLNDSVTCTENGIVTLDGSYDGVTVSYNNDTHELTFNAGETEGTYGPYAIGDTKYTIKVVDTPVCVDSSNSPFITSSNNTLTNAPSNSSYAGKPITKLTISSDRTYDIDLSGVASGGTWSSLDESIVTVDQNGVVTPVADPTGVTTDVVTYVTYTVNGESYTIPVVVMGVIGSNIEVSATTEKHYTNVYVYEIMNTTVYYTINLSHDSADDTDYSDNFIETQEGEVIYLSYLYTPSSTALGFTLNFFGKEDKGYALTYMAATDSAGNYYALNTDTGVTGLDAYTKGAINNARAFLGDEVAKGHLLAAIGKGCHGTNGFTRYNGNTAYSGNISSNMTFRSRKLPTLTKEIVSVNDTPYVEGMTAKAGDTIEFKVTVTQYVTPTDEAIEYTNDTLTDDLVPLTGNNHTVSNFLSDAAVTSEKTYVYNVSYTIKESDLDTVITNTATLNYKYSAKYSNGTFAGKAEASAKITATTYTPTDYVIDFGLPIDIHIEGWGTKDVKTISANYAEVTISGDHSDGYAITYTPNKILQGADTVTMTNTEGAKFTFKVYPATTVYYEENFINWDGWTTSTSNDVPTKQTTEKLGSHTYNYGYDLAYDVTSASSTDASTGTRGASGSFTFTGNGVQVFANCTSGGSNYVAVQIKDSAGAIKFFGFVDTNVAAGDTSATDGQTGDMANLPIVSLVDVTNLDHGTYTVTTTKIADDKNVKIDGIRIFNTLSDSTIFKDDLEDDPDFYELRDAVLNVLGVKDETDQNPTSKDYKKELYEQVYDKANGSAAIITDESVTYAESDTLTDLLDNGPKNELFLYEGQTLTFKVKTNRMMQLGMKAPQGETNVAITVNDITLSTNEIKSPVDMFYALNEKPSGETTYTVSVKNTGDKLLSVTLLKICDDPNAAFVNFSASDIAKLVGYKNENQLPFEPEFSDAHLKVVFKTVDGTTLGSFTMTANGKDSFVFTDDIIESSVVKSLPDGYVLPDSFEFEDVKVDCGTTKIYEIIVTLETSELPTDDDDDSFDFDYFAWLRQIEYLRRLDEKRKEEAAAKREDTKIEVETEPEAPTEPTVPTPEKPELPFNDIADSDWYFEDVRYAYENGLMIGTSDSEFTPEQLVNRAMLVTILWRLEGSPTVDAVSDFTDVPDGEWYSDAVKWAAANGLVNGYGDGKFGPLDDLTREQIMAILNRYADYKGLTDGITVPMLPAYTYSTWAENNVIWADMCGMLANIGKDVTDMTAAADRAEMAAYLRRFCENIVK